MSAQNQHYVPDFLLKNFRDSDGKIFRFDKQTDEILKRPTSKSSSEKGFYEFNISGKSISFEKHFEKIETAAAPAIRQIIESRNSKTINSDQKYKLAEFITVQSFRTEAFQRGIDRNISRENFCKLLDMAWENRGLIVNNIMRRDFVLLENSTDQPFYIGDQPITFQHSENPKSENSLGFGVPGVEAYLPLTPNLALYLVCETTSRELVKGYLNAKQMHQNILTSTLSGGSYIFDNQMGLKLSQRIMKTAGPIYEAIKFGTPLNSVPENVENFNYLQVSWASSFVYSCKGDFEFAQRMLFETPNFRKFPKVKFAILFPNPS
jgi:Protein of unknown function (DUF4238)